LAGFLLTDPTKLGNPAGSIVTVRDANDSDIETVQGIYAHQVLYGLATFEEVPPAVEDLLSRRQQILSAGLPYLVAISEGRVAGYAYASSYRPRPAYRHTVENSVYVAPEFQSRGIGSALLGELITRCEAGCWRQMIAVIGNSGNVGSIALHTRFGFERIGVLKAVGFKLGQWVDTVLMQRKLGAGDTTLPGNSR
jgi:L-amino acid N-acyltransferase YncA